VDKGDREVREVGRLLERGCERDSEESENSLAIWAFFSISALG
jgi:hypothetical protein